jgi:histidinol-phosphate/aromatic aminotransferase/cobyric acid decarboxylase-like protein/GNAT superfamily N-acetyltransferase
MMEANARKAILSMADAEDRAAIYEMRHAVYAEELGQHATNSQEMLSDLLDDFNEYVVARIDGEVAGFISITPPGRGKYSIDKYVARDEMPVVFDDGLYELRVLTVAKEHRNSRLAAALMYAGFRWAEERGATHYVAMGRTDVVSLYLKQGFNAVGREVTCGAVKFELLEAEVALLRGFVERHHAFYTRILSEVSWEVGIPFFKAANCFHGGAFFEAIGAGFETLEKRREIISADVLDAWFPPSPKVLGTLHDNLEWLLRTSPPTHCEGLREAIARYRGVEEANILPGAGSSDLIFMAFRQWLSKSSRVLILDPMYGEYAHILEKVIGCQVDRLNLPRRSGYAVNLDELKTRMETGYDLVVLVNPNNPTGRHVPRAAMEELLAGAPRQTRIWADEAYLEYVGPGESLEKFAARSENVIVCKTMSKVYGLSGARVGYLCAARHQLSELIELTPPWAVGLVAQVAAVRALESEPYYATRYRETHTLRTELMAGLREIGIREIVPSVANFVLFHLEPEHPTCVEIVDAARERGVFFRDISRMGRQVGTRALRTAVKDRETNARILKTLAELLGTAGRAGDVAAEDVGMVPMAAD